MGLGNLIVALFIFMYNKIKEVVGFLDVLQYYMNVAYRMKLTQQIYRVIMFYHDIVIGGRNDIHHYLLN